MIWGDTTDQYHQEIMDKLENIELKIDGVSDQIEQQTFVINNIIQEASFRDSYTALKSMGTKFASLTRRKDNGAKMHLKDKFSDTHEHLHKLDANIRDYFKSIQDVNTGCCVDLHKIRAWLSGIMINALFGSAIGCELRLQQVGNTLDNGKFHPEKDCLMTEERNMIISINNKMVEILEECEQEEFLQSWLGKFINGLTPGTAPPQKALKDQVTKYLDKCFPQYYYAVIVYADAYWVATDAPFEIYELKGQNYAVFYSMKPKDTCQKQLNTAKLTDRLMPHRVTSPSIQECADHIHPFDHQSKYCMCNDPSEMVSTIKNALQGPAMFSGCHIFGGRSSSETMNYGFGQKGFKECSGSYRCLTSPYSSKTTTNYEAFCFGV